MAGTRSLSYSQLQGWGGDDHAAALGVYAATADLLDPKWPRPVGGDARLFIETHFDPFETGAGTALITGYYEPELEGAATRGAEFGYALYSAPADLTDQIPWHSRSEIEDGHLLDGHEIVWLTDPVDAFFAQVQGSARVRLRDGSTLRLGHAGKNGHPYRSIGAELVARGEVAAADMSAEAIRRWCARNPEMVAGLLRHNPSYGFFKPVDLPETSGPIGNMGRPVSALRSVAVDPDVIPLGAMVWVEANGSRAFQRLMIAQDTGSAIKGGGRVDVFCGTGIAAGQMAGQMKDSGRIVMFLPKAMAEEFER